MNQEMTVKGTGIIRFDPIAAALSDLESRLKNVVHDVTTTEGMAVARKDRAEVRRYRIALEKGRVEEKDEALQYGRKVDRLAKELTAALLALEEPIDLMIKNEESRKEREKAEREAAEAKRIADIQDEIAALNAVAPGMVGSPSATIADRLRSVKEWPIGESFAEFKSLAQAAKDKAVATLMLLHAGARAQEDEAEIEARRVAEERAELARLRAEQNERNRQEAARKAEEEHRKIRQEQDKRDAELKAAADRLEAQRRETEEKRNELLDGMAMLRRFVERFGKRREFAAVVKAISAHLNRKNVEAEQASLRA